MAEPAEAWDNRFSERRPGKVYEAENRKPLSKVPPETARKRFLSRRESLDPPNQSQYSALKLFLERSVSEVTDKAGIVLLDDRRDRSAGAAATLRKWDSEGPQTNYMNYPPAGDPTHLFREVVSVAKLTGRLKADRERLGAEKRNIYIANITSGCIDALIQTAAERSLPVLRNFTDHHIRRRHAFDIHFDQTESIFNLELHIPFFTFRSGDGIGDPRTIDGEEFRRSRPLPLGGPMDHYYEGQISFLVSGIDEWFWQSYCFVDTYFGEEEDPWEYYKEEPGGDPASGGHIWLKTPVWNPREYFLVVLSRRMRQTSLEWIVLINTFEEKMDKYQQDQETDRSFVDDHGLSQTESLHMTVATIRRFRDCISGTIDAWEEFEGGGKRHLETTGSDKFCKRWEGHLIEVRKHVSAFKSLQKRLEQKMNLFDSKLASLMSASSLSEATTASRQGSDIGIFTRLSTLIQTISITTAIFSMAMIPGGSQSWIGYACLSIFVFSLIPMVFRYPRILYLVYKDRSTARQRVVRSAR